MFDHLINTTEHALVDLEERLFNASFERKLCFVENWITEKKQVQLTYFIGTDWIIKGEKAIYVAPKINSEICELNFLKMLFDSINNSEISSHTKDLFDIKFEEPYIEIKQTQDVLTPLLVLQFLKTVQNIVRKGLRKSYYRVENNLSGRIKGKVMVSKTIKENIFKNRLLNTYCNYDEFGLNGYENRILKKALLFVQRYLSTLRSAHSIDYITSMASYVLPAFESISSEVDINEIRPTKPNVFYKEYEGAIKLAKLIMKRFGHNLTNIHDREVTLTPPFWINMAKLFEIYVLAHLKNAFGNSVKYHFSTYGNELDFLLNTSKYKMVIDAKYKPIYFESLRHQDIRQVSGYARLQKVYKELGKEENENIDCLIVYPNQEKGLDNLLNAEFEKIPQYVNIYKVGIKLPIVKPANK
ncbi:MAG: hypothetical protein JNJ40_15340 [Bacteroidia bacterium]|nr:hypothetical protein [Bacteroidia bacterium]